MHRFDDDKVHCPYFREHIVPLNTASYHCQKCELKYKQQTGKDVFHCRFNYMHIFLSEVAKRAHETSVTCKAGVMSQTLERFVPPPHPSRRAQREQQARREERSRSSVTGRLGSAAPSVAQPQAESVISRRRAGVSEEGLSQGLLGSEQSLPQANANRRRRLDGGVVAEEEKENHPPNQL